MKSKWKHARDRAFRQDVREVRKLMDRIHNHPTFHKAYNNGADLRKILEWRLAIGRIIVEGCERYEDKRYTRQVANETGGSYNSYIRMKQFHRAIENGDLEFDKLVEAGASWREVSEEMLPALSGRPHAPVVDTAEDCARRKTLQVLRELRESGELDVEDGQARIALPDLADILCRALKTGYDYQNRIGIMTKPGRRRMMGREGMSLE